MKKLLNINKYKQGRVLEYGGGEEVLDPELSKTVIHAAENNINKGVSKDGRYYTAYSDGVYNPLLGRGTMTLGDGVAETSDAPKHWFSGKPIPAKEVDDWTYSKMQEGVKAVKDAYNERFGTKSNPTPGDTITPSALAAVASTRYKLYRLGKHTNPILDALKSGLHSKLESALSAASGLNRSNRIVEALGGSYYKRAFGGRLIPKGQVGLVTKIMKAPITTGAKKIVSKVVTRPAVKTTPGYQLKSLLVGSPIEKQMSNTGTIHINSLNAFINKASDIEKAIMNKVLQEKFAGLTLIDYNLFRLAVQDELITYLRVPLTKWAEYGMDRIGFDVVKEPDQSGGIVRYVPGVPLNTFTFESPRIPYGITRHYSGSPLGHIRTFATKENPDVLYVLENLSDWGLAKFNEDYPRYLTTDLEFEHDNNAIRRFERYVPQQFKEEYNRLLKDRERYGSDFPEIVQDLYSDAFKEFLEQEIEPRFHSPIGSVIARWNKRFFPLDPLRKYLHDNYPRRQLLEILKYAAENGLSKMRYPTPETAAKIEGYSKEALTPEYTAALDDLHRLSVQDGDLAPVPDEINIFADNPAEMIYYTPEKRAELLRDAENRVAELEIALKDRTYRPEHQTILKKYKDFPKQFNKLYKDQEVRTVTDAKGNTWFEVDIPNGYLQREWPYKKGGRLISKHQRGKIIGEIINRIIPKVSKQLPKLIKSTPQSAITKQVLSNGKIRLSLPGSTNVQPRLIVLEPQGNNKFYVYIRTWDDVLNKVPATMTLEQKQLLFDALYDELPEGAEILFPQSGPDNYATRGTVAGLLKLSRDPRFTHGSKGILQYKDNKTGEIREFEGTSFIKK